MGRHSEVGGTRAPPSTIDSRRRLQIGIHLGPFRAVLRAASAGAKRKQNQTSPARPSDAPGSVSVWVWDQFRPIGAVLCARELQFRAHQTVNRADTLDRRPSVEPPSASDSCFPLQLARSCLAKRDESQPERQPRASRRSPKFSERRREFRAQSAAKWRPLESDRHLCFVNCRLSKWNHVRWPATASTCAAPI